MDHTIGTDTHLHRRDVKPSAELFLQHCQVPNLSNTAHLKALTKELTTEAAIAAKTHKG